MSACACGSPLLGALQALEDRDRVALADLDDGLLPGAGAARGVAPALGLGLHARGADLEHLDVGEELLDGLPDLRLVRLLVHAERVLAELGEHEGLLGDDRADHHLAGLHQDPTYTDSPTARATTSSSARSEISSEAAPMMSAMPACWEGITLTR